jgi:hypothetical protein
MIERVPAEEVSELLEDVNRINLFATILAIKIIPSFRH